MTVASDVRQILAGLSLAMLVAAHAPAATAGPSRTRCDAQGITVVASLAQDAMDACQGAKDAMAFFDHQGLRTGIEIEISVQDTLPPVVSPDAAGCFLQAEGKVLVRTYAGFRRNKSWFKVPIDRRLYRSLATHEVAHALAACNFTAANPSLQAKEYVAYVAMFSSMEAALRARILKTYREPGFKDADRLTALLCMFDPMRFGVQAYRFHTSLENARGFLQDVLAGRALAE